MEEMNLVIKRLDPAAWRKQPATPEEASSSATVQYYLNKACDYIKDDGVGMVGIHGMGGVGKTTLLKTINNHLPAAVGADRFDHVIWVVASQDLNINNLQKLIAEKVSFHLDFDSTTVEERGESLCYFLREKKILLFLDDIWQPIELGNLGVCFPTSNNDNLPCPNKVVFTTRSDKVCNQMMAYHIAVHGEKIKVDCLQQDGSNLGRLEKIAWEVNPGVVFRNLTTLMIFDCRELKSSLTWIGQLLYLERLLISGCSNLVQVIGDTSVEDHEGSSTSGDIEMPPPIIFSHLKYLQLFILPELTSFSSQKIDLRSLKYLEINECPRLDLSPFSNHTIHS